MKFLLVALPIAVLGGKQVASWDCKGEEECVKYQPQAPEKVISEPSLTCPVGYTLVGEKCERELYQQPEVVCPIGELVGDQCVLQLPELSKCPEGFTRKDAETCAKLIYTEPLEYCPHGYTEEHGKCTKIVPGEIIEKCPVGVRQGDLCVLHKYQKPIVDTFCPPHSQEAHGKCFVTELYDCTPTKQKVIVDKFPKQKKGVVVYQEEPLVEYEEVYEWGPCPAAPRYLKGGHHQPKFQKQPKQCKVKVQKPKYKIEKVEVVHRTCEKQVPVEPLVHTYCPAGFTETPEGKCLEIITHPIIRKCSVGGSVDECFSRVYAPFEYECPPPTVPRGKKCVETLYAPVEHYCPPQSVATPEGCFTYHEPILVCEDGYDLEGDVCTCLEITTPTVTYITTCEGPNCLPKPQPPIPTPYYPPYEPPHYEPVPYVPTPYVVTKKVKTTKWPRHH